MLYSNNIQSMATLFIQLEVRPMFFPAVSTHRELSEPIHAALDGTFSVAPQHPHSTTHDIDY